jgi:hypothetical protein
VESEDGFLYHLQIQSQEYDPHPDYGCESPPIPESVCICILLRDARRYGYARTHTIARNPDRGESWDVQLVLSGDASGYESGHSDKDPEYKSALSDSIRARESIEDLHHDPEYVSGQWRGDQVLCQFHQEVGLSHKEQFGRSGIWDGYLDRESDIINMALSPRDLVRGLRVRLLIYTIPFRIHIL